MITYNVDGVKMPKIKKRDTSAWIRKVAASHGRKVGEIGYMFVDDEKILEVNNEYLVMRVTRNVDSSSSDMARLNATKCRKDATETLKALVKTVEIEYTIHGLKVCGQLILSLGKIFDRSRSIVNARATRRRKAKELAAKIAPVASRIDMTDDMPFVVGKFSKLEDRPENLDLITEAS